LFPFVLYFSSSLEEIKEHQKDVSGWIFPHSSLQGSWFEEKSPMQPQKDKTLISHGI